MNDIARTIRNYFAGQTWNPRKRMWETGLKTWDKLGENARTTLLDMIDAGDATAADFIEAVGQVEAALVFKSKEHRDEAREE